MVDRGMVKDLNHGAMADCCTVEDLRHGVITDRRSLEDLGHETEADCGIVELGSMAESTGQGAIPE